MSNYTRGRAFEYRVRDHCKTLGWLVCRSPQSRSAFDLIAVGQHDVLLIQCKVNGKLPTIEWNELIEMARRVHATPILATRVKRKLLFHELLTKRGPEDKGLRTASYKAQIAIGEQASHGVYRCNIGDRRDTPTRRRTRTGQAPSALP